MGNLDVELRAVAAAEDAEADLLDLSELEVTLARIDRERVREGPLVERAHAGRVALDAADRDVAGGEPEDEPATWADPLLDARAGSLAGLAHRSALPSARMAVAASSALISRRASRSRICSS